jgi:hypothetical protein
MIATLERVLRDAGLGADILSMDRAAAAVVVWLRSPVNDAFAALSYNRQSALPVVVHPDTGRMVRRLTVGVREQYSPELLSRRLAGTTACDGSDGQSAQLGQSGRVTIDRARGTLSVALFPSALRRSTPALGVGDAESVGRLLLAIAGPTEDRYHRTNVDGDLLSVERVARLPEPERMRGCARELVAEADDDRFLLEHFLYGDRSGIAQS